MRFAFRPLAAALALAVAPAAVAAPPAPAPAPAPAPPLSYADLADLAEAGEVVAVVEVARQIAVPAERAASVAPGRARLYLEAKTRALLAGSAPLGESVRYLADVPLDAKGKAPKLKKRAFIVFARAVPGRPGELQLAGPDAQVPYDDALAGRVRAILAERAAPGAPPAITGVRDALAVPGTLAGESETQVFLASSGRDPVTLTVIRRSGRAPEWGVSYSEIVDQAARPPAPGTLGWYRLACFLPPQLPARANLAQDPAARAQAAQDYAFVLADLGPCGRSLARAK